jgi:hypothetical protein
MSIIVIAVIVAAAIAVKRFDYAGGQRENRCGEDE